MKPRPLGLLEAAALALTLAACAVPPPPGPVIPAPQPFGHIARVRITAEPVPLNPRDPAQTRVGDLTWLWGVSLRAEGTSRFGGLSGLEVTVPPRGDPALDPTPDPIPGWRYFTAVSDEGDIFRWHGMQDPPGRGDIRATYLGDERGVVLRSKAEADAEALTVSDDGQWFVSFERRHRVRAYPNLRTLQQLAAVPAPAPRVSLPENRGFEALAVLPLSGRRVLAVGAEDGRIWFCPTEGPGDCTLFLRGAPERGYSLTGLDHLPGTADLVAVYRSYNPLTRETGALIARITSGAAGGRPGAVRTLARLQAPLTVDNMEGIAALDNGAGGWTLYLLSDNNFSPRQRTLLLAFDYSPPTTTAP